MPRLLIMFAVLLALAATVGVATSHAMAYSSTVVTATAEAIACGEPETAVVVSFKSCGKKASGIVMPCNQHAGVLPPGGMLQPEPAEARYSATVVRRMAFRTAGQHLRPPIAP